MSLAGRTVLLTRDPAQSSEFILEAERLGALVLPFPTIAIAAPDSWMECDRAIGGIAGYTALAFTSANAVRWFCGRCGTLGLPAERLRSLKVYAVGVQTGGELEQRGLTIAPVPERYSASALADAFGSADLRGQRFLIPQGNLAREELGRRLAALGAEIDAIIVYRTLPVVPPDAESVWQVFAANGIDVVVFASPSAALAFAEVYPAGRLGTLSDRAAVAVIGPTTERAVRDLGWKPVVVAGDSTMPGLLRAIELYFR